jgi:hypothetical protein
MKYTNRETLQVVDMEMLNEEMGREIAASELHYQRWARGMVHLGDAQVGVTEEMSGIEWVGRMEKAARRIATRDERATRGLTKVNGHWQKVGVFHELTALGTEIVELCKEAVPVMEQLYPGCQRNERDSSQQGGPPSKTKGNDAMDAVRTSLNPYIAVMLRACQSAGPIFRSYGYMNLAGNNQVVRSTLERLTRFVRRVCRSKRFKYTENNYSRNEREGFRSCCQYMAATFARFSKLLIMRVDLYILPEDGGWANTIHAEKCARRFLRALREGRIVPDVEAWICRRENGFRRGIHLHLLVAIDGHKHREAATFSKMIGEAWVNRFSDGHGTYFNCWARKNEYRFNCLGSVHISDRKMLIGVREAIRYMTKGAFHVTTGYPRNLWRGIMRQSWGAVKRGAPRKAEHDISLVSQILGDV